MWKITEAAVAARIATMAYICGAMERMRHNERGQGAVEYVGIVCLVVVLILAIIAVLGNDDLGIVEKLKAQVAKLG